MKPQNHICQRTGMLLAAAGTAILAGASLAPHALIDAVPAVAHMGLSTALCFLLLGLAMMLSPANLAGRKVQEAIAATVIFVVVGRLFGLWAEPAAIHVIPGWPGAMSIAAAHPLLAAAILLLLRRLRNSLIIGGALLLYLSIPTIAAIALFGYAIEIPMFYTNNRVPHLMSEVTALLLLVLAIGMGSCLAGKEELRAWLNEREERRTFLASALLSFGLTTGAGLTSIALVADQGASAIKEVLIRSVRNHADLLAHHLRSDTERLADVARHTLLVEALRSRDRRSIALMLEATARGLHHINVIGLGFIDASTGRIVHYGESLPATSIRLRVDGLTTGSWLLMEKGWRLETRIDVHDGQTLLGELTFHTDQRDIESLILGSTRMGTSKELLLCAGESGGEVTGCASSYPNRKDSVIQHHPDDQPRSMALALAGLHGVRLIADDHHAPVLSAYTPVGTLGLGMVQQIDAGEIFQSLRTRMLWSTLAMLLLIAIGTLLLHHLIVPHLRRRRHAMEELERWKQIFEHTEWGVVVGSADGKTLENMNPAFARMHGYTVDELQGQPITTVFAPEVHAELAEHIRIAHARGHHRWQGMHIRRDGSAFPAQMDVTVAKGPAGEVIYRIVHVEDISERKAIEELARKNTLILKQAQAQAHLGSWHLDIPANILSWSEESHAIFGVSPGATLTYETFLSRVHPEDREYVDHAWRAAMRGASYDIRHRLLVDGKVKWVRERAEVEFAPDGSPLTGIGTTQDITESKEAEDKISNSRELLRNLAARREMVREEERARIAREVHDELGQLLTALKMDIGALNLSTAGNNELRRRLNAMGALVDRTIGVVRHVARNLRPAVLDHGLVAALEWLAEDFERHAHIPCLLAIETEIPPLDTERVTTLFRIVQESLTNVMRHAAARHVDIAIRRNSNSLNLLIADDGHGFDPSTASGFGLLNLRERCIIFQGNCEIVSAPGQGTRISIEIPLDSA